MKHELTLEGMSCGHCVMAVREALESRNDLSVESVEIGKAIIQTPNFAGIEAGLRALLAEEGYPIIAVKAA